MLNILMSIALILGSSLSPNGVLFFAGSENLSGAMNGGEAMKTVIDEYTPNELGEVMIVMYHNLVEKENDEGYYARSYENFRKDLIRMHEEGYVLVTMDELVKGEINVPAGKTPIALTFDDARSTDIQLDENGKPTNECVVGIMESVREEYPDFVCKATFYLNGPAAFGDNEYDERKIKYMVDNGYQISNHTSNHADFHECSLEEAREEIVSEARRLEKITGSKEFHFALPFGHFFPNYESEILNGLLGEYTMLSSVNVGWNPIASPFAKDFNKLSLNRVTCGEDECELYYWMDNFKNNPELRFYSDGVSNIVTFPKSEYEKLELQKIEEKKYEIVVYDDENLEILKNYKGEDKGEE